MNHVPQEVRFLDFLMGSGAHMGQEIVLQLALDVLNALCPWHVSERRTTRCTGQDKGVLLQMRICV